MSEDKSGAVEAFEAWCEELAAKKARNAVPGEPAPPMLNAVLVSGDDLAKAYCATHPEQKDALPEIEAFAKTLGSGLEVDKAAWAALAR
jgi:hypothetical protein